ncbi:MAG: MFS transporter [Thermodesulfobacteriota bacterium]|nr:MFS transporter [Thermodesulfobacteriota bacterium]
MEAQVQKPGFYGWKNTMVLSFIYMIVSGIIFYGFSVIFPAMITEMGWRRGDAALAHTIRGILVGLLSPVAAFLINRFGGKKTITFGIIVLVVGLFLLGTAISKLWHWLLIWGFIMPFGFAFAGMLPTQAVVTHWFNIRRATVLGLVTTGAPLGGFIAQPFFTWLIQEFKMWQIGWVICGVFALLSLIAAMWIRNKPEELGQSPDGLISDEITAGQEKVARTYRTTETWTLKETITCRSLWLGMLVNLGQLMALYLVMVHGVLHLTDLGYSKMQAASVISFIILGSGFARFPMGWLGDMIEPRWICSAAMAIMFFTFCGIWKAPTMTLLIVTGPVFGFCYGTIVVLIPAIVGNYWGPASFASTMGFIMPFMIALGAPVPVIAGYIADHFGTYDIAFITIGIIIALGAFLAIFITPPQKTKDL